MSKKRRCIVCDTSYEFCMRCNRVPSDEYWRNIYCSQDCREIFKTCSRFEGGAITADEAYEKLIQYNVEGKDIQMSVKNSVERIKKGASKKETKPEVTREIEQPTEEIEKPKRRYRRRKRTDD